MLRPVRILNSAAAAGAIIGVLACGGTAAADSLSEAMRLVPADAVGAIVVPDLKRANDELTLCLERMDRPEAFFVGRPIDLVKAQFGLSVAVRDGGAVVAALRWPADADAPRPVLFMPVSDASAFIAGNFVRDESGALRSARGDALHALDLGRWVALAPDVAALDGLAVADAADTSRQDGLRARLGERATALLKGEVLAWIDGAALRRLADGEHTVDLEQMLGALPIPFAVDTAAIPTDIASTLGVALDGLDVAAIAVDLDALGVIVHGALRYAQDSTVGSALRTPSTPLRSLGRLPDNVPYWALSLDLTALLPALAAVAPETVDDETRALLEGAVGVQWGCWPSRLGVAVGGLLNDSSLLVMHRDPAALRERVLSMIEASAGEIDGVLVEPQVERDRALRSGGVADAFEIRETALPDAADPTAIAVRSSIRSALFGNRGVHGLVRAVPDGVIVTFSQRPDVLGRATDAGVTTPALAGWPVIAAMRDFMVDRPSLEGYLGVGELARVVRQIAATFGAGELVPQIEAGAEPIGVALSLDDGTLLGSAVVPSGVLGALIDVARQVR